ERGLEGHVIVEAVLLRVIDALCDPKRHRKKERTFYHIFPEIWNPQLCRPRVRKPEARRELKGQAQFSATGSSFEFQILNWSATQLPIFRYLLSFPRYCLPFETLQEGRGSSPAQHLKSSV